MNRRIGQAMHAYDMLADGDRVLVAVSGGVDSLVLTWLLGFWRLKAPVEYELIVVHVDMEPGDNEPGHSALAVQQQLDRFDIQAIILPTNWQPPAHVEDSAGSTKDICYQCARERRKRLFDFAETENCTKIALGHHQDDIIETFFINLCYAGNISTMVPKQELFEGRLSLIRPLAFLNKTDIYTVAENLGIQPVPPSCPLSEQTGRREIRHILSSLYDTIPGARSKIFAALGNVRHEYLLHQKGAGKKPAGGGE